jgi:20S proteasome alpha/beta subunit
MLNLFLLFIFRGVRPFGVSLLMAGWDEDEEKPYLYQCDPSVSRNSF